MERNRNFGAELSDIAVAGGNMTALEWFAEQMPGGCFIYREEPPYEILYVNQAAVKIYGCKSVEEFREFTGNSFKGMVYKDDFDSIQSSIERQINEENNEIIQSVSDTFTGIPANGSGYFDNDKPTIKVQEQGTYKGCSHYVCEKLCIECVQDIVRI